MCSTFDDSSDYGSDFTPDEEELLNDLLARVATQCGTGSSPAVTALQGQTRGATVQPSASLPVGDIEDYGHNDTYNYGNEDSSSAVRVLGRGKDPVFKWTRQVQTQQRVERKKVSGNVVSSQVSSGEYASGTVFSLLERFPVPVPVLRIDSVTLIH